MPAVRLTDVTAADRRACADLEVAKDQRRFVAPVTRYLCLCHYGGVWQPGAVTAGDTVIGFVMRAVDEQDGSGWIDGLVIGREDDELVARLRLAPH